MTQRRRLAVILADVVRVLPKRGRGVTRRTVRESQRWRMFEAITEAVAKRGYADATVSDVIKIAAVSRKTFYVHFRDKEDCFLRTYEVLSARLIAAMGRASAHGTSPANRRRAQLATFLDALARDPAIARVFMVDVLGAGARALKARERVNASFALAVLGAHCPPLQRAAVVGGVNALVVSALLEDRAEELPKLLEPICAFIERKL